MTSVCGRVGGPRTVGIPLPPAPPRRLRYSDSLRLASPRPPTGSAALALTVVSPAQLLRPAAARPLQLAGVGRADLLALAILAHRRLKRSSWTELISGPCRRRRSTSTRTPNQVNPDFLMEAATVASSGTGLRCSLNPVPIQQRRSARVGFMTERQPCAVTCRRLLLRLNARPYRAASASAALDSGAGNSGVSRKRLTVFVSGGGSNFRSIHEAALGGEVNGDVVALVTDKPGCGGAEYARCNGIPVVVFPKSKSAPEGVSTDELLNVLRDLKVDFVLLAGYLKLIPGELVQAYPRSMLNIHPSLLPAFGGMGYYGSRVHKAVIASGARVAPTIRGRCSSHRQMGAKKSEFALTASWFQGLVLNKITYLKHLRMGRSASRTVVSAIWDPRMIPGVNCSTTTNSLDKPPVQSLPAAKDGLPGVRGVPPVCRQSWVSIPPSKL